ncbi:hypothetical protein VTJ83DRAFT_881 [Remersonia thermophila]|uniref:UspA domain-containing protein n=1 Tax=Remersonia thermophila TaxID=72144 RepID=A0ABR4DMI9_9PEZI
MAEVVNHVARLNSSPAPVRSPDPDRVSPGTQATSNRDNGYFAAHSGANSTSKSNGLSIRFLPTSSNAPSTTTLASGSDEYQADSSRQSSINDITRPPLTHASASTASSTSVTFRPPRNPSLPQGIPRKTDNRRLRQSSPSPVRFEHHVGFDNVPIGEATKNNPSSFTLQARHQGYHPTRRSRTFMIGVDDHNYSQYALVWLLTNMVDDGDEVVCVRVVESPVRPDRNYQEDARQLLETIMSKNELNKAISIVLEYSVGKLHDTFQQLIAIYNPSMLVVGTKGRSLGGFQGLMNARNSFSKYCLQYSPVPVVVVRPDDKRQKKKDKRSQDPSRQSYAQMLAYNAGKHEVDSDLSDVYEFEKGISADEEAHRVAAAIGLPARFDPTIKPYKPREPRRRRQSPSAAASGRTTSLSPPPSSLPAESGDEENDDGDDDDDDDEFEAEIVSSGAGDKTKAELEWEQKERLHAMEMGEAAALLKSSKSVHEYEEDDDDDSQGKGSQ